MECSVNNFQFKQKIIKNITLQIQNQITKEIVIKGKVHICSSYLPCMREEKSNGFQINP